jgi:hypothetical protein
MQIVGKWLRCDDGITRPVVAAKVVGADGTPCGDLFLVDSASDRTAFSAAFLTRLQLLGNPAPLGISLKGIGGASDFVVLTTAVEFLRDDGGPARVHGSFAAFTDPAATDFSILGRDVLNNFDVILSRLRNDVLLLATNHQYQVVRV